jgi:hypothetical protein
MLQHQSNDIFIPAFLLKLPHEPENNWREKLGNSWCENTTEDFLNGIQGWTEDFPVDECDE